MTTTAPFGSWKSPITSALLTSAGIGFGELQFCDSNLYWLESRPDEGGRVAVVRCSLNGKGLRRDSARLQRQNSRPRVWWRRIFRSFEHNLLQQFPRSTFVPARSDGVAAPITPKPPTAASLRYADGRVTQDGTTIVCVRERHEEGREAINEIVSMPADGSGPAQVILSGYDFYSFPRINPDGKQLAWTCWRHPKMPWDGTELWVGDLDTNGSVSNSRKVAGSSTESIFQPEWSPDGALCFISDRTGWWNLYAEQAGKVTPFWKSMRRSACRNGYLVMCGTFSYPISV
jgi:hypothetical protein